MIQIFGKKKCFDTKKAERFFKERRVKVQFIDLLDKGISPGEYKSVKSLAEERDFRCFFGIEVTMEKYPKVHMLIYGVAPRFLEENMGICDLTQSELFNLVKKIFNK